MQDRRLKWIVKIISVPLIITGLWWLIVPADFLEQAYDISPDTMTYTNAPSLYAAFFGAPDFDTLRTPGFALFLYTVSLGDFPRPDVIQIARCDSMRDKASDLCNLKKAPGDTVVSREGNVAHGYTKRTDTLFRRAVTVARLLALFSFGALIAGLARRMGFVAAAASVAFMVYFYLGPEGVSFEYVLQTEILFPAVFFLYVAAMLEYIATRRAAWLYAATLLTIFAFLVRPAYVYVPIVHAAIFLFIAVKRRAPYVAAGNAVLLGLTCAWFFLWAPTQFFNKADDWSAQLRTAVLSDQATVDCITEPKNKLILSAWLRSIENDTRFPAGKLNDELRRYYDLAGLSWKINLPEHPIYRERGIAALAGQNGAMPTLTIRSMLLAAAHCNFGRNVAYSLFNVALMLGIVGDAPYERAVPHFFFWTPIIFFVCCPLIFAAIAIALGRRDGWHLFALGMPSLIYFGTVAIVALKQGGEARYSFPVEPLFVLSAAISFAVVVRASAARLFSHRFPITDMRRKTEKLPVILSWLAKGRVKPQL